MTELGRFSHMLSRRFMTELGRFSHMLSRRFMTALHEIQSYAVPPFYDWIINAVICCAAVL
jgi:hypothetical protein